VPDQDNAKIRIAARNKAFSALKKAHPAEFHKLYQAELDEYGLTAYKRLTDEEREARITSTLQNLLEGATDDQRDRILNNLGL
jgi:hypothetical protein